MSVQLYLVTYNVLQILGWSVVLVKTVLGLLNGLTWPQLYESVEIELKIFQTAAILEVIHAVIGLVRSPVGTTAMQVTSRVVLVWPILHLCSTARYSVGVPLLLVAWSVTEVIRYSFYALSVLKQPIPYFLLWLRYTLFYVLYPMGVSGELLTLFASLKEVDEKKILTLEMPNRLNMGISFWWVLIIAALTYIPGFPQLYFYMIGQRKKVLGGGNKKKQ
ncbi:hypothetical protein CRE_26953 [Caenorhabditis remanei]|uniref:Very-long-chain (3R)-3-hydroxyacyl-CoA dehydratase n=1 Tax=Caenorhabditis remanei TaxID=31234 RepID=E3LPG2_CAERE|nr:hypothetical protein CRE_26953 [Caenorhabditis remanei]